jgi:hypothetical protein
MDRSGSRLSPAERACLARKGEILCERSCGKASPGTCAESFVAHQWRLGRVEVAHDVLRYLDERIAALREADPDGRLPTTEALAAGIRRRLSVEIRLQEGAETQACRRGDE